MRRPSSSNITTFPIIGGAASDTNLNIPSEVPTKAASLLGLTDMVPSCSSSGSINSESKNGRSSDYFLTSLGKNNRRSGSFSSSFSNYFLPKPESPTLQQSGFDSPLYGSYSAQAAAPVHPAKSPSSMSLASMIEAPESPYWTNFHSETSSNEYPSPGSLNPSLSTRLAKIKFRPHKHKLRKTANSIDSSDFEEEYRSQFSSIASHQESLDFRFPGQGLMESLRTESTRPDCYEADHSYDYHFLQLGIEQEMPHRSSGIWLRNQGRSGRHVSNRDSSDWEMENERLRCRVLGILI